MEVIAHEYINKNPELDIMRAAWVTRGTKLDAISVMNTISIRLITSLIESEHSPIRSVVIRFYLRDIPYWVQNHLVRHHEGINWFVGSQRSNEDRGASRQDTPVDMIMDANIQALINLGRARLCTKAAKETRQLVQMIKDSLAGENYWLSASIAAAMKPKCEWYNKCFEAKPCGRIDRIEKNTDSDCFCEYDLNRELLFSDREKVGC